MSKREKEKGLEADEKHGRIPCEQVKGMREWRHVCLRGLCIDIKRKLVFLYTFQSVSKRVVS